MKIFTNIRYLISRVFLAVGIVTTLFAVLPYESLAAHNLYRNLAIISWVMFVVLTICGSVAKRQYIKKGGYASDTNPKAGKTVVNYVMLLLFVLFVLLPFYVMFVTSIKTPAEAGGVEFTWWPQNGVTFEAYKQIATDKLFNAITVLEAFLNTLKISILPTIITVLVSSLSAYAFAKLEFKGKGLLFGTLLLTMMVPGCITLTSSYLLYDAIGWTRTYLPLVIPQLFGGASIVFFLRQYFSGIPDDLLGSAKIDGLGKMGIFAQIILPISVPAFVAQLILTFVSAYNNYMGPLLYLYDPEDYTLQLVLSVFRGSNMTEPMNPALVSAACIFSIAPLLLAYFLLSKVILSGISMSSGLKG